MHSDVHLRTITRTVMVRFFLHNACVVFNCAMPAKPIDRKQNLLCAVLMAQANSLACKVSLPLCLTHGRNSISLHRAIYGYHYQQAYNNQ